ncbi:hypothetical protein [Chitinophaga polysaccharea]|uniref:hypothetical protein n=1 Tax=Chitinophaga polysaccharea TaxID=1293035 RepID=UPI00115A2BA7|nr:hypothetical protein [Chitinophaga polysaccharea]
MPGGACRYLQMPFGNAMYAIGGNLKPGGTCKYVKMPQPAAGSNRIRWPELQRFGWINIITTYQHKKANSSGRNCLPNILSCL